MTQIGKFAWNSGVPPEFTTGKHRNLVCNLIALTVLENLLMVPHASKTLPPLLYNIYKDTHSRNFDKWLHFVVQIIRLRK